MYSSPPTIPCAWLVFLVCLPLTIFEFGCDAGMIDPNAPVGATGMTGMMPGGTGMTGMLGDPEAVVINEIFPDTSQVELHNPSAAPVDIGGFWLCHTTPALIYAQMPDNTIIDASGFLIVHWGVSGTNSENEIFTFPTVPIPMNIPHGEFGFYVPFPFSDENFSDSNLIRDYVQWGEADHFRQGVAVGADIWPGGAFVPSPPPGQSFSFNGSGDSPDAWVPTPPTLGAENDLS